MAYIILDKIKATAHIENIVATEDLVNGQFVALGALQPDGEERLVTPSGDTTKRLVLHASNGLVYRDDENELDFVLKAGKSGRGFVVETSDIVSFSEDLITGEAVKGSIVVPAPTGLAVHTGETAPVGLHGEVIAVEFDAIAGKMFVVNFVA